MVRRDKELRDAIERVTAGFPGMEYRVEQGKHIRVILILNGKSRFALVPTSGSDHRGMRNNIMVIRRVAREIANDR